MFVFFFRRKVVFCFGSRYSVVVLKSTFLCVFIWKWLIFDTVFTVLRSAADKKVGDLCFMNGEFYFQFSLVGNLKFVRRKN